MPAYFSPDACFCPLCGKKFNARAAWKHINDYHPKASEKELKIIRDAKREEVPFATKPVRATKSSILCQPYWSSGPDYSGGLPSLGKKR